jgi:FkbM family methyltransferase
MDSFVAHSSPDSAPAFNYQKACRYGQMLYNINDFYIGRSFDLYGEHAEQDMEILRQIVREGDVVLDLGANIGGHTLFFARQVGSKGAVLAFEPQRLIYYTLCANVALNSLTNVWCFQQAVGAAAGTINVPLLDPSRPINFGGVELGRWPEGERVSVITIDSLDLPRCNLMKVDVEGMEKDVLRGALGLLDRCKPMLYVENDRQGHIDDLVRYIDELGYTMYWHITPLYNPNNYFCNPENIFDTAGSFNMLCIHKSNPWTIQGREPIQVPRG